MRGLTARLRKAVSRPRETVSAVVTQVRNDDVPFMAGSIAYQAFISLFPLLVLLFIIVAAVGDEAVAQEAVTLTEGVLPDAAQSLLSDTITENGVGGTASVIGVVTLVWGSLKIFRGLDTAFSEIYETGGSNSIADQLRDGLVVFAALAVSLVAMTAVGSLFAFFERPFARVLNLFLLVAGLTVAFLPMYRFFPDANLSWAEALPGAVFAALGWTLLQSLFQFYVALSGANDASSVVGAVLLLLTWLYLAGFILLLGAVVNAVLLDEGSPEPQTSPDYEEQFHRERDRRQSLQHELARLERRLDAAETTAIPATVAELRARNRQLQRRIHWLARPWPVRLVFRALGRSPQDETVVDPGRRTDDVAYRQESDRRVDDEGDQQVRTGADRQRQTETDRRPGSESVRREGLI